MVIIDRLPESVRNALGQLKKLLSRIGAAGTQGYPPDTQRRLKILNMIAMLIAITTLIYAVQQSIADYHKMMPIILINVFLAALALLVPFAHRISDIAGGLLLVGAEFVALLAFTAYISRAGGAHIQYFVAAAAPFVVFGLQRLRLIIAMVVTAAGLHLFAWYYFRRPNALLPLDDAFLNANYIQGVVTTFALIAASVYYAFSLAERAKAETDAVLRNVLPDSVVERLKAHPKEPIADGFATASVLFADIKGFVSLARTLGPEATVALLNRLVSAFDALAEKHGVEKIKTIGDAYMVASGVPEERADHVEALASMALDMLATAQRIGYETGHAIDIRIGMAAGPMMAGVIGRRKFSYDVWGDPVNIASRLEQASEPGRILICPNCFDALAGLFQLEKRGAIEIKGVGSQETWYVTGKL